MARATPKKLKSADSPSASKGKGSILNFFARTPSDSVANGGTSSNSGGAVSGPAAGLRRASGGGTSGDVKPNIGKAERHASNGVPGNHAGGLGRADNGQGVGSVDDPMVISDEEDDCRSSRTAVEGTSHVVSYPTQPASDAKKRPKMPVGKAISDFGEWEIDIQMEDAPGPSRPRSRTRSRTPPELAKETPIEPAQTCSTPPPFAGMPHFKPPPSWPQIVNTADVDEDEDDTMLVDDCGQSDGVSKADFGVSLDGGGDRGKGESSAEGDEGQGEDRDGDDDSIADRSDGRHAEDDEPGDREVGDDEEREIELSEPEEPEDHQPTAQNTTAMSTTPDKMTADPADTIHQPFAGLDMEWGDDAEEGMGMDDFGEEEGLDLDEPAAGVLGKRKDKTFGQVKKGKTVGGGKSDNIAKCPMCDKSLKGKSEALAQKHINTCLDTCPASPAKGGTKPPKSASHPISSFAPLSPAPSPSPSPEPDDSAFSTGNGSGTGQKKGPNAFSVLMSGHKEREQWKDAEIDLKRDGKRTFGRRKAPFYKVMTGMPVAVDAFRYGAIPKVTAYLLTHAHSDHYTNLSKSWNHGPIYCSQTTANLIVHMLGVEPQWVHGLPDNVPFVMPNTGGVKVTPIEANHCPGSSIFLFEGPQTVNAGDSGFKSPYVGSKRLFRYLHCGDFRACPKMVLHPEISRAKIDTCYLDTTYLNPKYCFPPQPQVIEACAQLARKTVLGLPDDAPPLRDVRPPVFDLIKAEHTAGMKREPGMGDSENRGAQGEDVKPDVKPNKDAIKYEPGLAEIEAEERGKAMMKGWLVNKEEAEAVKQEGDPGDGVKVKREEGEVLVSVEKSSVNDDKNKVQAPTADQAPKKKGRTLVVMGTYSIGKERIVKAVAQALGTTIYCDPRKRGILLCQTDPELHALLSTDPISSHVHLLPLGNIQLDRMQEYLVRLHPHFDRVLGFRPTGWSYSPPAGTDMMPDVNTVIRRDQARWFTDASLKPMRGSCRQYMMYGVPYSEHSSFFELSCFALSMPGPDLRMIATVNVGNEKSRAKMKKWFEKWLAEKARRKEKNLPAVVDYRDITYW